MPSQRSDPYQDYLAWLAPYCEWRDHFRPQLPPPEQATSRYQELLDRERDLYEEQAYALRLQLEDSAFWKRLWKSLRDSHELARGAGGLLAHPNKAPDVLTKSWESLVLKSYRRNVLDNPRWPAAPDAGWTLPENWLERVSDIVRTTIVVRYLDGIPVVEEAIATVAEQDGEGCTFDYENRDTGYYALHATPRLVLKIRSEGYRKLGRSVPFEIQVCTQVQEVLRSLTHQEYEAVRRLPKTSNARWQWKTESPQFTPNYLGHILHYADGMMLNLRRRKVSG